MKLSVGIPDHLEHIAHDSSGAPVQCLHRNGFYRALGCRAFNCSIASRTSAIAIESAKFRIKMVTYLPAVSDVAQYCPKLIAGMWYCPPVGCATLGTG